MSKAALFLRNVASNWAGFAVNAVATLLVTPIMLEHLGASRYGVWVLTTSIVGYYGLLDLGLRAGVTQYLTRYFSSGDLRRASQCLSTAVVALGLLAAVLVMLSVGIALMVSELFGLPADLHRDAFWCVLLVGLAAAVGVVLSPFAAVFMAVQRFDLANAIGIASRVVAALGVVVALKAGYGLVGVCAVTCGVSVLDYVARTAVATRLIPALEFSPSLASGARLREMMSFGGWSFLISITSQVVHYLPNLVIGWLMPIAAVAHYSLAAALVRQISALLNPISTVAYPAAIELHVQKDMARLERLYVDASRLLLLVLTPVVLLSGLWAEDFYRLWIGEEYLTGEPFHSVAVVLRVLVLSIASGYLMSIASQILLAAGCARHLALTLACGSLINITLTIVLIPRLGVLGPAIAVVAASFVIDLVAIPLLFKRLIGFSFKTFLAKACLRPAAAAAAQAASMLSIRALVMVDGWVGLALQGALAALASAVLIVLIGLNESERRRFVFEPVKSIAARFQLLSGDALS